MHYTTVFPLRSKVDVRGVLTDWIIAFCRQLSAQFQQDLQVLRCTLTEAVSFPLASLRTFVVWRASPSRSHFWPPPQQNGIAERRIGLIKEVARTSMIHAAAPHFLWPFAARYAALDLLLLSPLAHVFPSLPGGAGPEVAESGGAGSGSAGSGGADTGGVASPSGGGVVGGPAGGSGIG
ncbi:unnamed protein product [Closterium sp. NIES-53]